MINSGPFMLLIAKLIDYYSVVVIVAVFLSWLQLPPSNQVVRITRMLTEPALAPIRRLVPSAGADRLLAVDSACPPSDSEGRVDLALLLY